MEHGFRTEPVLVVVVAIVRGRAPADFRRKLYVGVCRVVAEGFRVPLPVRQRVGAFFERRIARGRRRVRPRVQVVANIRHEVVDRNVEDMRPSIAENVFNTESLERVLAVVRLRAVCRVDRVRLPRLVRASADLRQRFKGVAVVHNVKVADFGDCPIIAFRAARRVALDNAADDVLRRRARRERDRFRCRVVAFDGRRRGKYRLHAFIYAVRVLRSVHKQKKRLHKLDDFAHRGNAVLFLLRINAEARPDRFRVVIRRRAVDIVRGVQARFRRQIGRAVHRFLARLIHANIAVVPIRDARPLKRAREHVKRRHLLLAKPYVGIHADRLPPDIETRKTLEAVARAVRVVFRRKKADIIKRVFADRPADVRREADLPRRNNAVLPRYSFNHGGACAADPPKAVLNTVANGCALHFRDPLDRFRDTLARFVR